MIRTGQSILLAHVNLDQLVQEYALTGDDESFLRDHLRAHSMVALPLIAGNRVLGECFEHIRQYLSILCNFAQFPFYFLSVGVWVLAHAPPSLYRYRADMLPLLEELAYVLVNLSLKGGRVGSISLMRKT